MILFTAIFFQASLLLFHLLTTLVDFYPFTNMRAHTQKEHLAECSVSSTLMALPLIGFFSPRLNNKNGAGEIPSLVGAFLFGTHRSQEENLRPPSQ